MTIEIVDLPIDSMVMFHSYVSLYISNMHQFQAKSQASSKPTYPSMPITNQE